MFSDCAVSLWELRGYICYMPCIEVSPSYMIVAYCDATFAICRGFDWDQSNCVTLTRLSCCTEFLEKWHKEGWIAVKRPQGFTWEIAWSVGSGEMDNWRAVRVCREKVNPLLVPQFSHPEWHTRVIGCVCDALGGNAWAYSSLLKRERGWQTCIRRI
jgi:hypothetical protein